MVYLEHSSGRFWRCEKTAEEEVTISFGKCGFAGRTMKKTDFATDDDAIDYVESQEASKLEAGYKRAADPLDSKKQAATGGKKRKASAAPKKQDAPAEVDVDTGVAEEDAALASRVRVHDGLHAKLALVDPKSHDKYHILQVLVDDNKKKQKGRKKAKGPQYYLFARWGRTGTGGKTKLEGPWDDEDTAVGGFAKVFKLKTGVVWSKAVPGAEPKQNKYEYLATSEASGGDGFWYYHLVNDPLGKPNGWYAYDEDNRVETEGLHGEYVASGNSARLSTRLIHSDTSGFTYRVDLQAMTQTNTQSGTTRPIMRSTSSTTPKGKPKPAPKQATTPSTTPSKAKTPKRAVVKKCTPRKSSTPKSVSARGPVRKSVPAAAKSQTNASMVAGTVDPSVSSALQKGSVFGDFFVTLNQTNLEHNNNKFYIIQLVETTSGIYLFTKWGRVGEPGRTQELGPMDSDRAVKEFEKKFRAKTLNDWDKRDDFQPQPRKYTIVEMEKDASAAEAMSSRVGAASASSPRKILPSKLDAKTKALVDLIFDEDTFNSAMSAMNIDPAKLPLGALSTAQINRGITTLESIEEEIDGAANSSTLMRLTSEFYTIIPHAFGRSRGPVLNTKKLVNEKYDMLNTLTDIEAAQAMQKNNQASADDEGGAVAHPADLNYQQLSTDLTLVGDDDEDRSIIEKYLNSTKASGYHGGMKLRDVWRVDRHRESDRFAAHKDLSNRKLLWHGTNVAVVAAILKSGLRIMPHSGGRVGRGIYLADQHEKSAWYVSPARGAVIMFLVEAALGRQHEITTDDPSLVTAPKGYDSVLAKGTAAPNKDVDLDIDGVAVKVPQGKPVKCTSAARSSFAHNEFLIYKESQHRIRYILRFDE